jgi:hypothetical protein
MERDEFPVRQVAGSAALAPPLRAGDASRKSGCDGEVRRQFNVCFRARIVGGELTVSDESTELRFVDPAELASLPMHHTQRLRLRRYLENSPTP